MLRGGEKTSYTIKKERFTDELDFKHNFEDREILKESKFD